MAFQSHVDNQDPDKVLNQFISRDAIAAWSAHLDYTLLAINDGDAPHIPLTRTVRRDDGMEMRGLGHLGQSVCVLGRP